MTKSALLISNLHTSLNFISGLFYGCIFIVTEENIQKLILELHKTHPSEKDFHHTTCFIRKTDRRRKRGRGFSLTLRIFHSDTNSDIYIMCLFVFLLDTFSKYNGSFASILVTLKMFDIKVNSSHKIFSLLKFSSFTSLEY